MCSDQRSERTWVIPEGNTHITQMLNESDRGFWLWLKAKCDPNGLTVRQACARMYRAQELNARIQRFVRISHADLRTVVVVFLINFREFTRCTATRFSWTFHPRNVINARIWSKQDQSHNKCEARQKPWRITTWSVKLHVNTVRVDQHHACNTAGQWCWTLFSSWI